MPLAVYMPVANKRRIEAVREAAMRFPVRRRSRASFFQSIPLVWLLMNTFFMQSHGATRDSLKQHLFCAQIESRRSKRFLSVLVFVLELPPFWRRLAVIGKSLQESQNRIFTNEIKGFWRMSSKVKGSNQVFAR